MSGRASPFPGVSVNLDLPIHQRTLQTVVERNAETLTGVTADTRKEVARVLADAMLEGKNPRTAARDINDRVDKIGMTRAETHARTVIVESYNQAALNRYSQAIGEDGGVTVLAEYQTAQDDRVCQQCAALQGNVYSVREARSMLPQHPRCRCAWLPVVEQDPDSRGGSE